MTVRLMQLSLALLVLSTGACSSTPRQLDPSGEPTYDGLLPVTGTTMNRVWAREGLDLRSYTRFMVEGAGLQYRPVGEPRRTSRKPAREFPLDERQKAVIQNIVDEEFTRALGTVTAMQMVEQPGPDTLIVRGGIIDIVSRVPPERPGRMDYYLDSVGQATFVIEFIDSQTNTVLARGIDTRAAETPGYTYRSNRVTNASEVRRLAAHWANLLAESLNNLNTIPELND